MIAFSHSRGSCREDSASQGCLRRHRLLQVVRTEVLNAQSAANCNTTAPDIGCPCIAEQSPPSGACSAGFLCRKVSSAPQLHAQPSSNDTAKCWPCSFGQYCPAGSYLSDDPYSLPQAVEQYTCRYQNLPKFQSQNGICATSCFDVCRTGHYCPTPDVMLPCPPGTFCSQVICGCVQRITLH